MRRTGGTGGGGEIQPVSKWFYYGAAGNLGGTLNRELTDQSIALLKERAAKIAALGSDKALWEARQREIYTAFGGEVHRRRHCFWTTCTHHFGSHCRSPQIPRDDFRGPGRPRIKKKKKKRKKKRKKKEEEEEG